MTYHRHEQVLYTSLFRLYRAIGDINRQTGASKYMLYLILGGIATIGITMLMPYQCVSANTAADNDTILGHPGGAVRKVIHSYNYTLLLDNTPGPWNRHVNDDLQVSLAPRSGIEDYCCVVVKSRGIGPAHNVKVTLYESNNPTLTLCQEHLSAREISRLRGSLGENKQQQRFLGPFSWVADTNRSFDMVCVLAVINVDENTGLDWPAPRDLSI
ncbi:uncharacterized protein BO66DRAFT_444555 [Aspergillus aculeatinus CBS 121060]|uniref:Uncharacterized protein n=1 Tax=Aspergillus aculeatinus CBS 121060 TaxID=1448322 RepID=A0ACD1GR94_9EURO|nr:hypothetical protein BO66DRAFT_444555 [Aspergillus aculeatinus CBS 121060]RAH63894.1 hypothetical protein BO66DRAFT_444555 [Aspergillus aculeatinus CBS 121060]